MKELPLDAVKWLVVVVVVYTAVAMLCSAARDKETATWLIRCSRSRPIDHLRAEAERPARPQADAGRRSIWSRSGIGAIIGAGLFVRTAAAAANNAGPSVTLGFVVAALGCAFAGLCYAEFASMIPMAGSAYTYAYATMGELVAWIIGWDLILEYAIGAATVGIAWSEYLNKLLELLRRAHPLRLVATRRSRADRRQRRGAGARDHERARRCSSCWCCRCC